MLTPEQWSQIGKQAEQIYSKLELEIIEEIAERITSVGYANTVVLNDILIAQEMGLIYQDVVELVAKHNNISASQIKDIFETAGVKSLEYDNNIYKLSGLSPMPLKQSKGMWQLLEATALKTNNNLSNLVMTTANTSQTQFYNAMNKAYMEVSTGVKSYTQSIIDAIKEVSKEGAYITYPSGRQISVESAVRMNIVTSVNQTCGKLQLMRAEELNWDLMELTAHAGARPSHTKWQGQIVSRSGKEGYLSLSDIGYGEATGFKGINCRHDWRPYYEGSTRTYTDKELKEMADETVTYNGQQLNKYDAQQIQRRMERTIRQDKKDIAGLQGVLTSNDKNLDINKVKQDLEQAKTTKQLHITALNDFLEQTNFRKDYSRLKAGITNNLESKQKINYEDITSNFTKAQKYKVKEQQYYKDEQGNKYKIDNKNVKIKANEKEREVAELLGKMYGGNVQLVPVVLNPQGIKTPDYIIKGEKFDLKEPTGNSQTTIYDLFKHKSKQADNFIVDIHKSGLNKSESIKQSEKIFYSKHRMWIKTIILMDNNKVFKVLKRK